MNPKKLLLAAGFMFVVLNFAHSRGDPPDNIQSNSTGKIAEGTIQSVDIEHNMFIMKTRITKIDTLHLDKSAIIRAGRAVTGRKDLTPDKYVKANYEIIKGEKHASSVLIYPEGSFLPDTAELGKDVLIAEGTIQSINDSGNVMVLKAPLEKEYVFSLDPAAVIKSGKKIVPLKELKPRYEIRVIYSEKDSRNIATSVSAQSK